MAVPERAFVPRTPEGYTVVEVGDAMAAREPSSRPIDLRMVYHVGNVEVQALRGVDIQVQTGEFVAIIGPSGCGKSTLLHLLGGLARPTSGRIFVDGVEISAAGDAERTAHPAREDRLRLPALQPLPDPHRAGQPGDRPADPGQRRPAAASGSWRCWRWWGCPTRWT